MDEGASGYRRLAISGLPMAEAKAPPQSPPGLGADGALRKRGEGPPKAACRGPHVLIVDDNQCNRVLLAHIVTLAGGTSEQATDGLEALERLAACMFDVVFMDIAMPRMDGIAATLEIRKRGNPVVILAVTAHYDARDSDKLDAIGFDGLIPKPIDLVVVLGWLLKQAAVGAAMR